mmetsp:Transcript_102940/g.193683  ORF Transcript_102940/g.193683 Transcript_102940/m.193683 type:complete len:293 (+) Transcript_102940:129-1007(+)
MQHSLMISPLHPAVVHDLQMYRQCLVSDGPHGPHDKRCGAAGATVLGGHAADKMKYFMEDMTSADESPLKSRREQRKKLHSLHSYVARTGAVAMGYSASMITRQVEQFAAADSPCPAGIFGTDFQVTTIVGVIDRVVSQAIDSVSRATARCGQGLTNLANAIGEPPHRPFTRGWINAQAGGGAEEQEAPLLLFWALNLCALCGLAGFFLFGVAFWSGGCFSDVDEHSADVSDGGSHADTAATAVEDPLHAEIFATTKLDSLLRVLGVIALSLVSGCGLGWRHPLQSGLLCGI